MSAERGATQQIHLVASIEAHPMMEVAAARMVILLMEEFRLTGIVARQLRLELDGDDLSADHYGPVQ